MFRRRNSSFRTETYILCIILGSVENSSENSWIFNYKWRKHTTFWNDICVQFQSGCSNICFRCWHCWIVILMHKIHIFYQTHTHARNFHTCTWNLVFCENHKTNRQLRFSGVHRMRKWFRRKNLPAKCIYMEKLQLWKFFFLVLFVLTMCLSWPVIKVVFIGLHY